MKKLMMVLAMGLALSSVGFARDRDDFNRRPAVRRVEADRDVRLPRFRSVGEKLLEPRSPV